MYSCSVHKAFAGYGTLVRHGIIKHGPFYPASSGDAYIARHRDQAAPCARFAPVA